jgi:hypothetical protein
MVAAPAIDAPRQAAPPARSAPPSISGVYPHLAFFNDETKQTETGVGAVVPFAGRLWVVTYSAHRPLGSGDGLFEITPQLDLIRREESVGGTPANRFVDRSSGQLFIGPHIIGVDGTVRTIPYAAMPGRYTATCADPFVAGRVLTYTMEEGLYRIDPRTLAHETLFDDGNAHGIGQHMLPGYHGKGAWSSQGVVVLANNGEYPARPGRPSGCLAEWDGTAPANRTDASVWRVVRRAQFTEVTGPGGLGGPVTPDAPIWALGWDARSVLLACREAGQWRYWRLPKGSFTYDGEHGWHTEWPRIRDVEGDPYDGRGRNLMTMHGQLWDFDPAFAHQHAVAPIPLTAYLRMLGDMARWQDDVGGDRIVFGTDDVSRFDNDLAPRSMANLWFVDPKQVDDLGGPALGWGAVWLNESVQAGVPSNPMGLAGYDRRQLSLATDHDEPVNFTLEQDTDGRGDFRAMRTVRVDARGYAQVDLSDMPGGWLRLVSSADASGVSAVFQMSQVDARSSAADPTLYAQMSTDPGQAQLGYGFIQGLPDRGMYVMLADATATVDATQEGFVYREGPGASAFAAVIPAAREKIEIRNGAVVIREQGRDWRLPRHSAIHDAPLPCGWARTEREIATERSMLHAAGTFFEMPRGISGGVTGVRPVASHDFAISDFWAWRGLIAMTGVRQGAKADGRHIFDLGEVGQLWLGGIDDLWRLGKPRGTVAAFDGQDVVAGTASDPCLMHGYDRKFLSARHSGSTPLHIALEIDVEGQGVRFHRVATFTVPVGKPFEVELKRMARWARVVALENAAGLHAALRYE